MYNEQLDQLIDACLMDGDITVKEKEILYNKAQSLGMNLDEFEILLNAKIYQYRQKNNASEGDEPDVPMGDRRKQTPPPIPKQTNVDAKESDCASPQSSTQNVHKDVKYCPACGTQLNIFQIQCHQCGHILENPEANNKSPNEFSGNVGGNDKRERDAEAFRQIDLLIDASLVDGKLTQNEISFLYDKAISLGISFEDFKTILNAKRNLIPVKDEFADVESRNHLETEREYNSFFAGLKGLINEVKNEVRSFNDSCDFIPSTGQDAFSTERIKQFQTELCEWLKDIRFEKDGYVLTAYDEGRLGLLASYLKIFEQSIINIENHSTKGFHFSSYYRNLTGYRALAIERCLRTQGISSKRIKSVGKGCAANKLCTDFYIYLTNETDANLSFQAKSFQFFLESILRKVQFEKGKTIIKQFSKAQLDLLAIYMKVYPRNLTIRNHTYKGFNGNNFYMKLTESRAVTIRNYLVDKGVESNRIVCIGMGADAKEQLTEFIFE